MNPPRFPLTAPSPPHTVTGITGHRSSAVERCEIYKGNLPHTHPRPGLHSPPVPHRALHKLGSGLTQQPGATATPKPTHGLPSALCNALPCCLPLVPSTETSGPGQCQEVKRSQDGGLGRARDPRSGERQRRERQSEQDGRPAGFLTAEAGCQDEHLWGTSTCHSISEICNQRGPIKWKTSKFSCTSVLFYFAFTFPRPP